MLKNKLQVFTFLAIAIVPSINLLAMHRNSAHFEAPHSRGRSHRDMQDFSLEQSQHSFYRNSSSSHEIPSWIPNEAYQQEQSQLSPRQKQQQKLNFVARGASYFGDALGLKSQGWLLEKENKAPESKSFQDTGAGFVNDRPFENKEVLIEDKSSVKSDRDIAENDPRQVFSDKIMRDIESAGIFENRSSESFSSKPLNHDKLQEYKDYYGVTFGPMFFKLYESTPEFLKSIEGFQKAATDFFNVFAFRIEHLGKTEGDLWTQYIPDAWNRFTQIWVNKFNEDGMIQTPVQEIHFDLPSQERSRQPKYNYSKTGNRRDSSLNFRDIA